MPLQTERSSVQNIEKNGIVNLRNGDAFRVGSEAEYILSYGTPVTVEKSPFLHVIQDFEVNYEDYAMHYELREHFYLWNGLYAYLLLGFSIVMLTRMRFMTGNFFALYFIVIFGGLIQWWWYF